MKRRKSRKLEVVDTCPTYANDEEEMEALSRGLLRFIEIDEEYKERVSNEHNTA